MNSERWEAAKKARGLYTAFHNKKDREGFLEKKKGGKKNFAWKSGTTPWRQIEIQGAGRKVLLISLPQMEPAILAEKWGREQNGGGGTEESGGDRQSGEKVPWKRSLKEIIRGRLKRRIAGKASEKIRQAAATGRIKSCSTRRANYRKKGFEQFKKSGRK